MKNRLGHQLPKFLKIDGKDQDEKDGNLRKCDSILAEKLFLLSFDLVELNQFYNFFIYCIFIILNFFFISSFPLNHMYNDYQVYEVTQSKNSDGSQHIDFQTKILYNKNFEGEYKDSYAGQAAKYFNIDFFLNQMPYDEIIYIVDKACHILLIIFFFFLLLLLTRERGTINLSSQRKIITKIYSFILISLTNTLKIPLITLLFKIYKCDNNQISVEQNQYITNYCYQGAHLNATIYTTVVIFLLYLMVFYFHNMLTLSYPHEKVPWAALPTKVPLIKEILEFMIVFGYNQTNMSQFTISYLNIVFTLILLFIMNQRLTNAIIFHTSVYLLTILSHAKLFVIFLFVSFRDFVPMDRNFVLHLLMTSSAIIMAVASIYVRERIRYQFLSKVDFALYENDFEALIMMFTLHELIERSAYDDKQDFLLRGFIERHIEICEYPTCSCIKFYSVCNSNYRLELAQMSPFSKNFDSTSMNQTNNNQQTSHSYTQPGESEVDDVSTLKVFYGRQKSSKKQNKSKAKFLKKFLIDNINVFLDAFPNSVKLHIMAAFIYFSIFKNSFKSLYELSFTKSIKSSYYDKYECFVLSSSIISYFSSRASQGVSNQPTTLDKTKDKKSSNGFNTANFEIESEIKQVIEFEKINIAFQKMIEIASLQTQEFWEEILKKNIDVNRIFEIGAHIYKSFIDIKKKYKFLMNLNNNYLEVAYLYKLFVSLILNFEIEVEDAKLEIVKIMQAKSMKKHNLKAEYKSIQLEDENGMIIISGCTKNFSKVLAMNNKAERIFGYSTSDLIDQKLQKLLPKLFAEYHDNFILNFIKGNRKINKENHNFVWGKHKIGYTVPLIMDINAYVNFEYNFCFIAFLKRSVLLEFKPMRELLEYKDVFVLLTNNEGIIQDMSSNLQEYLNFPFQALNKDINVESFFKQIFDDEMENAFLGGKRIPDFDPNMIKRILEEEDIDVKDNDSDYGANFNNISDKKCTAIVWLKNFEYDYPNVKLNYKEIWFVLTDEDTTYLDTKNTTEYMTAMGEEGGGPRMNVTYTDDREEICSIASVSSLANYDKNRKNILNKLSEIKTQTIDQQKPRQIELLQKAIVIVFLSVVSIAILVLVVSIYRNNGFFQNIAVVQKSKEAVIIFSQVRTLFSTLISLENNPGVYNKTNDVLGNVRDYLIDELKIQIEEFRDITSYLDFVDYTYSDESLKLKKGNNIFYTLRGSNEAIQRNITYMLGITEFINKLHDLTFQDTETYTFDSKIANYDSTNITQYNGSLVARQSTYDIYYVLKNSLGVLSNYLYLMSERYILDAIQQANKNSSLVLILTIISIVITFLTAFVIMPILHKIERSKEKVLMIYTELKKEQIESLNRNIKVFFMKLQQSTNNPGGSLFYQNSSKQFSGKLITRKYTAGNNAKTSQGGANDDQDFVNLLRRAAPIGRNEVVEEDKKTNVLQHFPLLQGTSKKMDEAKPALTKKSSKKKRVLNLKRQSQNGMNSEMKKSAMILEEDDSEEHSEDENNQLSKRKEEDGEDLSENAQEDKKAEILMSKEEAEHQLFKRIFQSKIKSMTCMKKVKYYILVICTALIMSGYFTLSYFMVTKIFNDNQTSLENLALVSNRGPFLDSYMTYYLQTGERKKEMHVLDFSNNDAYVDAIDFYYNKTLDIEQKYNNLRKNLPSMLEGSKDFIEGLESQDMCSFLSINTTDQTTANKSQLVDQCKQAGKKMLQLGLTQAINNMIQSILQGTIQMREFRDITYNKQQELFDTISVKFKYFNQMDRDLVENVKESIISYFKKQQQGYVIAFSIFVVVIVIAMILYSYSGVSYLLRNLVAIKFILNFIPGQWLLENNAAADLKYIDI